MKNMMKESARECHKEDKGDWCFLASTVRQNLFIVPRGAWLFNITADYFPSTYLNFYSASIKLQPLLNISLVLDHDVLLLNLFILHTCNNQTEAITFIRRMCVTEQL